jgi:formaldehyde-activating enzyme involved in methanogenesis
MVWEVFDKVNVPNKSDKKNPLLKAKCKYSNKLYSYTQGSTTTTLSRHMKKCLKYQKHVEEKLDQTLLNFCSFKGR